MIAVVQRVSQASVTVAEPPYQASIGPGLLVLLAVERGDSQEQGRWIAAKLANLRIFADDKGKMNRSVIDVGGEALVISQFTLAGDCSHGNRPSFITAADPDHGRAMYELVADLMKLQHGVETKRGAFGAMMQVSLVNDGPVTLMVRRPPADES